MNNKLIKFLPLVALLSLTGCTTQKNSGKNQNVDPFMIGDNLEGISLSEAQIIASEAYNNLSHISKVSKEIITTEDYTGLFVGALESLATKSTKKETYNVEYFKNVLNRKYSLFDEVENKQLNKYVEERRNEMTEWYNFKKGSETNFSLYSKTTTSFNGVEWDTYAITNPDFATVDTLGASWNKYLIKNSAEYSDASIHYDSSMHYVRDGMHILGYLNETRYETEKSPIAYQKEDVSLVREINSISVVAYVRKEGIGWITESVAVKNSISYLNNLSGVSVEPINVETAQSVASFSYINEHESHSVPKYKEDTSGENPLYISMFDSNTFEYNSTVATFAINDDYYRQIEAGYNGRAFYIEKYLEEGNYSIYDQDHTLSFDNSTYEVWGYKDIIENKCPSFIKDPELITHPNFFAVNKAGVYSFEIVFDKDMENITTFTVAKMG